MASRPIVPQQARGITNLSCYGFCLILFYFYVDTHFLKNQSMIFGLRSFSADILNMHLYFDIHLLVFSNLNKFLFLMRFDIGNSGGFIFCGLMKNLGGKEN